MIPRKRVTPRTRRCVCGFRTTASKCETCGTRKGTGRSNAGKRYDGKWRTFILARAGHRCEMCLTTEETIIHFGGELQAAHYERRGKNATRWHPGNGAALCVWPDGRHGGCHRTIDLYTPASDRRMFFASLRGEAAIAEVDDITREKWDKDLGLCFRRLDEAMGKKAA